MQRVADSAPEDGKCLAVQSLQRPGREIDGNLTGHVQILIKDKLDFLVLLTIPLDHTGTCVDLYPAAAPES